MQKNQDLKSLNTRDKGDIDIDCTEFEVEAINSPEKA